MPWWQKILFVGLAGSCGALARWGLTALTRPHLAPLWGTFVVNILGCLIFGMVLGYEQSRMHLSPEMRLILLTGFAGAFTTFSTLIHDLHHHASTGAWIATAGNLLGQVLLGIAALLLGMWLAGLLIRP